MEPTLENGLVGKVFINEILAGSGTQQDWVELVNISAEAVDLSGVRLVVGSPLTAETRDVVIPAGTTLARDELLVIDDATGQGDDEARAVCAQRFELPEGAVELILYDLDDRVIDRAEIDDESRESLRPGISLGRFPDATGALAAQSRPTPGEPNPGAAAMDPCLEGPEAGEFDDHTFPCIGSQDSFFWLAGSRAGTTAVKFNILSFRDAEARHLRLMDSVFYSLHDEWYFFRMLNGQAVEGEDMYAPHPGSFATVEEIYAWAQATDSLPHDETFLKWSGNRLLSSRFYDLAIDIQPRILGAGTLIYVPARTEPPLREAVWGFELEFRDAISHGDLMTYFDELTAVLPDEIASNLHWIIRSPEQEALAAQMEQDELLHHDRLLRYTELSVPGETEVYNGGLVAGRVRIVRAGEPGLELATTTDILVLEEIPDYLPPCRALITTVPQTPLAHISLLAESRGIPNLYIGDLTNDPAWDQWGRVRARIALFAQAPGQVEVAQLTEDEYDTWRDLLPDNDRSVPQVDFETVPRTLDLGALEPNDMPSSRPLVGGKSAGFLTLLGTAGLTAPDHPLAVTVRAYHEFLEPLRAEWLDELLALSEFRFLRHRQTRYLVLEGEEAYDQRYATPSGQIFKQAFLDEHPSGDWLGDLVRAGGVRAVIKSTPIPTEILSDIESAVTSQFSNFSTAQGLRFRSSSNVEDIEGFNGAGLYDSNTGFIHAESLSDPKDRWRTIESALLRTWASYWSWEAYDERLTANIDHLSGNMGVLVHARFDDSHELANGVLTVTRFPDQAPTHAPGQFGDRYQMRVNVQAGALSVANPPPGQCILPEVVRLSLADGELAPRIERLQGSSESAAGTEILSDLELLDLFEQVVAATDLWLTIEHTQYPEATRQRTVTLDFEFRLMAAGWPELAQGTPFGERMIVKQVRSLEPSPSDIPAEVLDMSFPRDVLGRARTVTRRVCTGDRLTLTAVEAGTDPLKLPDLGYDVAPFTAEVTLDITADIAELGWTAGSQIALDHTALASFDHPGMTRGDGWNLSFEVASDEQAALDLATLSWTPEQSWQISDGLGTASGVAMECAVEILHATPDNYLLELLARE